MEVSLIPSKNKKNSLLKIMANNPKKIGLILFFVLCLFGELSFMLMKSFFNKNIILGANNKLIPYLDEETGYWTFQTDRDFVILQLTDTHLSGDILLYYGDKMSLIAIQTMIERVNPDLVIITGDVASGPSTLSKTIPGQTEIVAELMNSLNVYWTVSLGNHDQPNDTVKEELVGTYAKYAPLCLFQPGPTGVYGIGNTVINIKNSKNKIIESLILIDSNAWSSEGGYDNIHEDQIQWYVQEVSRLSEINQEKIDSLLFIHIPLEEYKIAYDMYVNNGYKDNDVVQWLGGAFGEEVSNSIHPDDMFETIKRLNSTKAVFCGHDHFNYYGIKYMGIDLIYGMSIDYNAYAGCCTEQRGGTIITVHSNGTYTRENSRLEEKEEEEEEE